MRVKSIDAFIIRSLQKFSLLAHVRAVILSPLGERVFISGNRNLINRIESTIPINSAVF